MTPARILAPLAALRIAYVLGGPTRPDLAPLTVALAQVALSLIVLALLVATIEAWSDA